MEAESPCSKLVRLTKRLAQVQLHCHGGRDFRVRLITDEGEMLVTEIQEAFESAQFAVPIVVFEFRQRQRLARKNLPYLIEMVFVDVIVAERVNELTGLQTANVRDQMRQ